MSARQTLSLEGRIRPKWYTCSSFTIFICLSLCSDSDERTVNAKHTFLFAHTPGHGLDALSSVVLIVAVAGDVLQVVHVGSYQYGPQLHKVAVGRVFHCKRGKD